MTDSDSTGLRPLFDRIRPAELVGAQVIGALCGIVASKAGLELVSAVAIAVGVTLVLLIPVARRPALGWLQLLNRHVVRDLDADGERTDALGTAKDFPIPSGGALGLYWEDSRVVAVLEVLPPRGGMTRINRNAFDSTHRLPLQALAAGLNQHDILLDSIDIISHGYRTRQGTPAAAVYEQLIGPLPATASRTVWLSIGLDPQACPDAVARRGGGTAGAARTITIATQRIMRALEDARCRSRMLTAAEISNAVLQVTAGVNPRKLDARWTRVELGGTVNIGSGIDPAMLDSDLPAKLWVMPSHGTTLVIRLAPGTTSDSVSVGAAWRSTTQSPTPIPDHPALIPMTGRHREALLAALPVGAGKHAYTIPTREFAADRLDGLVLPPSGCGQLIGSDPEGNGIAARIVGPGISTVYIAAELYVAAQVVFRALAVGAQILIRTDRPDSWKGLVEAISNTERLAIAQDAAQPNTGFMATVVDGVAAPPPQAGVTTIYLCSDPAAWPAGIPDIALHQPNAIGTSLRLSTVVRREDLTVVSIPHESAYIGRPLAMT